MIDIFRTFLVMSISGSVLAVLLFVLKPLVRDRLPKAAQYYLWLVVIAALLLPVSKVILVENSVANPLPPAPIHTALDRAFTVTQDGFDRGYTLIPGTEPNRPIPPEPTTTDIALSLAYYVIMAFKIIYPFGVLAVFLYHIISYAVFTKRYCRQNTAAKEHETSMLSELCGNRNIPKLFRSPIAETPMLIGLFRSAIILPERDYTGAQLRAVLQHELTHLHRKDVLVKWLSVLTCAIHWFNPIVWFVRCESDRACELSCDEAVIRTLDKDGKQNYGDTLIYVAADTKTPHAVLSTTMCEEKKALKERLGAIMKSKKHTRIAVVLSAVLIITACGTAVALGAGRAETNTKDIVFNIVDSMEYRDNEILFQIPVYTVNPENLNIQIYGRAEYEDGFSRSLRFLEAENEPRLWEPGKIYSIPYDPAYNELAMDISYTIRNGNISEKSVDLLALVAVKQRNPTLTIYEYDPNMDNGDADEIRKHYVERLKPETDTSWIRLTEMIFIDTNIPDGTTALQICYAEAGTDAIKHIIYDGKYSSPRNNAATDPKHPTGNTWRVTDYFPNGFLGHIWVVTIDAGGTEYMSGIINVIFEPTNVPEEIPAVNTSNTDNEMKIYITDDGLSRIGLQDNGEFYVEGRPYVSYRPMGSYEIVGNILFLNYYENRQFTFRINGNSLIFESGEWLENWIPKETVFTLSEPVNTDNKKTLTVYSGSNTIQVEPSTSNVDSASLQWLDIEYEGNLLPFRIYDADGNEKHGQYSVADAETNETLEFFRPSGLAPQTYLFQGAESDHSYIVTLSTGFGLTENIVDGVLTLSDTETVKYTFGVKLP